MSGCASTAMQSKLSLEEELDTLVPKMLMEENVAGASIAVIQRGHVAWAKGYGFADKSGRVPMNPGTRFNIGSVSKTLTAWGVMKLVDEGSIDLDTAVDRYLRRWHLPDSSFDNKQVTVRRLLSHTAGLSVYPIAVSINAYLPSERMPTLEQALSRSWPSYGRLRIIQEPGTQYAYNNGDYAVLQLMIEDVTNQPFDTYMERTLFSPLGMSSTGYHWTADLESAVATPYRPDGTAWPHYRFVESGSGGAYTTAADLARFVSALSSTDDQPPGHNVLKPETVQQMITPADATHGAYGLGYKIARLSNNVQMLSHDGSNEGWRAMFLIEPQKGEGAVILTNNDTGAKIMAPIFCASFSRTAVDMSPLCSTIRQ